MEQTNHANNHHTPGSPRRETGDLPVRGIALAGVGLTVLLMVSFLIAYALNRSLAERRSRVDVMPSPLARQQPPPLPRLQVNPSVDLQAMRAAESQHLNSYGWVNREIGIVRIPIEQAKKIILRRGLPARAQRPSADGGS